jgi:hypothetical protein
MATFYGRPDHRSRGLDSRRLPNGSKGGKVNDSPIDRLLSRLRDVRQTANEWDAFCPANDDENPSLGIAVTENGTVLLICRSQECSADQICKALGLSTRELFASQNGKPRMNIVAEYKYVDTDGNLLYEVVRLDPKDFRQRRPDPTGKYGWSWNLKGVKRLLYRLPQVLRAVADGQTVYVVEGEKDADKLAELGLTATTNSGGAGKWSRAYSETLHMAHVSFSPTMTNLVGSTRRRLRAACAARRLLSVS